MSVTPSPLEQAIKVNLDRVIQSPAVMATIENPMEAAAYFRQLLDQTTRDSQATHLDHLLRCVIAARNPFCMNELVAWARSNRCLAALIRAVSNRLHSRNGGARLRNLLLDSACANAAAVLDGRAN